MFPRGHNGGQGGRQGSALWSARHKARQAQEGQQGGLHGDLKGVTAAEEHGPPPKLQWNILPPMASPALPSWKPPLCENTSDIPHPPLPWITAPFSPASPSPQVPRQRLPQACAQGDPFSPERLEEGTITLKSLGDDERPPHIPQWPMASGRGTKASMAQHIVPPMRLCGWLTLRCLGQSLTAIPPKVAVEVLPRQALPACHIQSLSSQRSRPFAWFSR